MGKLGWLGIPCALSLGCVTDARDEESGSLPTGVSQGDGASEGGLGEDGAGDDAPQLDVANGMGSADDGGDAPGCQKVDFLFVIDNSGSMGDEQAQLVASFPGFINTIEQTLDVAQDYHVMVIDSDPWVFEACPFLCTNPLTSLPCTISGFDCMADITPMECEDVLGAGVTFPRGTSSSNADCAFSSGLRFMDKSEADLTGAFRCAAQVGTGSMNDPEKPMEAMVQSVTPSTAAWDCNEGFLRDDAILVVTFITDEDDDPGDGSSGSPEGWKQALVAAKHGNEDAIVVLGLFGDNDQPGGECGTLVDQSGAEPSVRLRQFVESFGSHGFSGSVCASTYDQFFAEAVAIIDTTCDEFVPPG